MEIHLRALRAEDAPLMLEWMQDLSIARFFRFDAASMTKEKCRTYIGSANADPSCRHYAVADEADVYLGTISLKNIRDGRAEYAVSMRKCAHGTGAAMLATREILRIAFEELKLDTVYLNVLEENHRANAFYRKAGFRFVRREEKALTLRGEQKTLNWYEISRKEYLKEQDE